MPMADFVKSVSDPPPPPLTLNLVQFPNDKDTMKTRQLGRPRSPANRIRN